MIKGSIVALVTPMFADGSIDWSRLESLIDFHISNNTQAIVSVGTTGESATLDHDEHCEIMRFTVSKAAGKIPVIGGSGANSTQEALSLTQCARDCKADAALLVTPYYNKPTQHGLYLHYKTIAEAVDIPQLLYNVPGRTACDLLPATVAKLAEIPNIAGIKEATGDIDRMRKLQDLCPDDFLLISGDDATACEFMLSGGDGVVSVTANLAPALMRRMCGAALAGDRISAQAIDRKLAGLHCDLFIEPNPIPVKWGLYAMDKIEKGIRLPMTWLSADCEPAVRAAMDKAGINI